MRCACSGLCCPTILLRHAPVNEGMKLDLRDEVEFRQMRLNAQSKRMQHSVQMYTRDALQCHAAGEAEISLQMVGQKLLMERRVAMLAMHWSLLDSVRTSLRPGLPRVQGDIDTCRAILEKAGPEQVEHSLRIEGAAGDAGGGLPDGALEAELARLVDATVRPSSSDGAGGVAGGGDDDDGGGDVGGGRGGGGGGRGGGGGADGAAGRGGHRDGRAYTAEDADAGPEPRMLRFDEPCEPRRRAPLAEAELIGGVRG